MQRSSTSESRWELMTTAAPAAACADGVLQRADAAGVEPGQRFVEKDCRRPVQVGAADGRLLPHSPRQFPRRRIPLGRQLELLQERRGRSREVGHAIGRRNEVQMLPDRQGIEKVRIVRHEGQLLLGGNGILHDVMSADQKPSAAGLEDTGHRAERRSLPRPVGTEHAEDRPGGDLEREILHRQGLAVAFRETGYGNHASCRGKNSLRNCFQDTIQVAGSTTDRAGWRIDPQRILDSCRGAGIRTIRATATNPKLRNCCIPSSRSTSARRSCNMLRFSPASIEGLHIAEDRCLSETSLRRPSGAAPTSPRPPKSWPPPAGRSCWRRWRCCRD